MKKKITLTLNLEDTIIVNEDDEIDYVTHITFGAFCKECNIEIEELKEAI